MALGHSESVASGLKVWDMSSFNHPGGFRIDTEDRGKCNRIHCTWNEDSSNHRSRASNTDELYEKLAENDALEVGYLAPMNCDGSFLRNFNLCQRNFYTFETSVGISKH